ncbi:site-specific integrase [Thermoplasmatales archaeon AK]|nr:site-specific integrase [Thermoplasmatales archaeon AK]
MRILGAKRQQNWVQIGKASRDSGKHKIRNRLIIEIFAFTGVRVGELEKINIEDIRDGTLYIRSEKGEKDRHVPLPERLLNDISTYVEKYRMQSDQRALFTTDGGRMAYTYIRTMIKKVGTKLGMPQLHPHPFRHFYGTYMYKMTSDLRLVQMLLGHARIETTTIYEQLSTTEAAEKGKPAVERLFRTPWIEVERVQIPGASDPKTYIVYETRTGELLKDEPEKNVVAVEIPKITQLKLRYESPREPTKTNGSTGI